MTGKIKSNDNQYCELILYLISFLFIIITPFFAGLISPFFDFAGYGALRKFFDELFTSILWLVEIIAISVLYYRKYGKSIIINSETKGQELPLKRVALISIVVVTCIVVISAQIRFQVKPFYDLGEKFNGYDLTNNIGVFVRNVFKCVWIVIMLRAMQNFIETILDKGRSKIPYAGVVLMLTVGVYDIITGANNLAITYLFLYVIYGWLYLLTDRSMIKTYLLVVFLFLF